MQGPQPTTALGVIPVGSRLFLIGVAMARVYERFADRQPASAQPTPLSTESDEGAVWPRLLSLPASTSRSC
jgi:hypothetical protein